MDIDKFKPDDLLELGLQLNESYIEAFRLDPNYRKSIAEFDSWTVRQRGKVVACGGIIPLWNGRSQAWSMISSDIGGAGLFGLTKFCRKILNSYPGKRVEATVVEAFPEGCRWVDLLGFEKETPMPMAKFLPDGRAAYLYSRMH